MLFAKSMVVYWKQCNSVKDIWWMSIIKANLATILRIRSTQLTAIFQIVSNILEILTVADHVGFMDLRKLKS